MTTRGPESGLRLAERNLLRAADRFRERHRRELSMLLRARVRFAVCGALLIALAAGVASWTYGQLGRVVRAQVHKVLLVTRDAAIEGALLWVSAAERAAVSAVTDPLLAPALRTCIAGHTCAADEVAREIEPYMRSIAFSRFRLADASGQVWLDGPSRGHPAALSRSLHAQLAKLRGGEVAVVPPPPEERRPLMFVVAALPDGGALVFDLPMEGLSRVLRAARGGRSAETYAFDANGRLLTESRFTSQLHQIGLLPIAQPWAALTLSVRDPGGDMTTGYDPSLPRDQQPFTQMVQRALAGQDGADVQGYRDYRGVSVVGAWRWLAPLSIGIATEFDTDEALMTLFELRRLFAWMVGALGCVLAATLVALAVAARMQTRVFVAEQLAERFGQYRIVRKLGQGGMGRVYLADHELLRRPAAIKLLRADRSSPEAIAAFEHEVQITSTLTHPNTIAVYDYGRAEDGSFYYVMEYLEGLDLQRLVHRFGPMPSARVIHMLCQLCGSLSEAHAAGLIHRDIKPANLLVCTRGGMADVLKVLDFGVAHVLSGARVRASSDRVLVGTPEYMAPEVFESAGRASPQTDLYAVGAVGYFLLTGSPPFDAEGTQALCLAHLTEAPEPPSRRLGQAVDPVLERAILLCLSKRREARPANADALMAMLSRSELAEAWTKTDARTWWSNRAGDVASAQAVEVQGHSTPPQRVRPSVLV